MRTSELLVYAIVLIVFLAFNVLRPLLAERLRRLQRRQQGRQEPEQLPEREEQPSAEEEPWVENWGRSGRTVLHPSMERAAEDEPAPGPRAEAAAVSAQPSRHGAAKTLFASRKDLRRAIAVMTVLGPCRALEPHDRA